MPTKIVQLEVAHLKKLLVLPSSVRITSETLEKSYFSKGSVAYCLLEDGEPVFAGGVANLEWHRGEAWVIPNAFFHAHQKTCLRIFKKLLPEIAEKYNFRRVQAVCGVGNPETLFRHLGFEYEGTLKNFGPFGEACKMYSRTF